MQIQMTSKRRKWPPVILCGVLLTLGAAGLLVLASQEEALQREIPTPPRRTVSVITVNPIDIPFTLTGFGELKVLNETVLAAEVHGRAVYLHPKLKTGQIMTEGELLVQMDDRDYRLENQKFTAAVNRLTHRIQQLETRHPLDRERYAMAKRNQYLARNQYDRLKRLYNDHGAGSRSDLGAAEQALNRTRDECAQLALAIKEYPYAIGQARCERDEARAQQEAAQSNIRRCRIHAPFNGRVKSVAIQTGQYVAAGQTIAALADDSVLEVEIALAGLDICQWLQWDETGEARTWFQGIKPVDCRVYWLEAGAPFAYKGRLHRAVRFDPHTHTLILAVRVETGQAGKKSDESTPLAEGMFCRVEIPGKTMHGVYPLPGSAVYMQKYVYLSNDRHLKTAPVEAITTMGNETIVGSGLNPGDRVIVTPLVHPVENTCLDLVAPNK